MKISTQPKLNSKAIEFIEKYKSLDINELGLEPYNLAYFKSYLQNIEYNVYLACELIQDFSDPTLFDRIFDLGGGIGFNSAFYDYVGFKEVVYIDIDPISTADARKINALFGSKNIRYITGNYSEVLSYHLSNSVICSRDVIEHIYNLADFFVVTCQAKANRHNTAAVAHSFFRHREFARIHFNAEHKGNQSAIIKNRDSSLSYSALRRDIVQKSFPDLTSEKIVKYTNETRGLMGPDILQYISVGKLPENHSAYLGSNTCDPRTGNWAERTLTFKQYRAIAKSSGLKIDFVLSSYNIWKQSWLKKVVLISINRLLTFIKLERLCPSFTIKY